jgi:cystathionine beta-lyase/cystathionine gamma-synthase
VAPPLDASSTYLLDDEAYALRASGRSDEATIYTREGNPTLRRVEAHLAALDGAPGALLFASGQAALHAMLLATVRRGERVVAARSSYGGTISLLRALAPSLDFGLDEADLADPDAARATLSSTARLVICESISNPMLEVADLGLLAELARTAGALFAVDATFASPIAQRPLEHGAGVVVHSATKYLGGHSDLVGGVLCGSAELLREAWKWRALAGGCMDPRAAQLLERGLKTLHLRVARQSATASAVARFLAEREDVSAVHHPSLVDHSTHALAAKMLDHPGGVVSFVLPGGDAAALALVRRLRVFTEASSLGGVESLASLPANMSHADLSREERAAAGIAPGLVRLSIGVEDEADLVADLRQALDGA